MFYFNPDKFEFWTIYDRIKYFYPIGIPKDQNQIYHSYPGLKELEEIIVDNIHDDNNFNSRWEDFTKEIASKIGKEIIGTTYGQAPSFSSFILLDTASQDNLTRTKELHFFVSLVGPFYTIIGQDNNAVRIDKKTFRSTNYLVISPENEYADAFNLLCDQIENRFKDYRFVPFEICKQTIEGLDVRYVDEKLTSIFNALFNNQVDLNVWTIGTPYFKASDWIKADYVDDGGGWTIYPPQ